MEEARAGTGQESGVRKVFGFRRKLLPSKLGIGRKRSLVLVMIFSAQAAPAFAAPLIPASTSIQCSLVVARATVAQRAALEAPNSQVVRTFLVLRPMAEEPRERRTISLGTQGRLADGRCQETETDFICNIAGVAGVSIRVDKDRPFSVNINDSVYSCSLVPSVRKH